MERLIGENSVNPVGVYYGDLPLFYVEAEFIACYRSCALCEIKKLDIFVPISDIGIGFAIEIKAVENKRNLCFLHYMLFKYAHVLVLDSKIVVKGGKIKP